MKISTLALGLVITTALTTAAQADKLDDIIASGTLRCAVVLDFPPMGSRDANNNPIGFDVDYCNDLAAALSSANDFKGGATASQQNTLSGAITVTVAEVLPNGVLRIRGEKWIRLNQGDEYVRLGGMVRVEDIDQANRLSSQRIADARITYAGRGALADSNQAGWLGRFFNSSLFPL